MNPTKILAMMILTTTLTSCGPGKKADLLIYNAKIYTVDDAFSVNEAVAVVDGRIAESGDRQELEKKYEFEQKIDAGGRAVYPGFIDGHCHFYAYGLGRIREADLVGTASFEEIVQALQGFHEQYPNEWLVGRGWDQNDWPGQQYPDNSRLDELFPDTPVVLIRVDGHAVIANSKALEIAGIDEKSYFEGGEVVKQNGKVTGLLIDKAADHMKDAIPEMDEEGKKAGLKAAEEECFAVGLTSVVDAGLDRNVIELIDSMQQSGELKMRVNAMISSTEENMEHYFSSGVYKTPRLHVNSVKIYSDGALGSRGALFFEPYSDDPGNKGLLVSSEGFIRDVCRRAYESGFQVNTHAIGDSATYLVLKVYGDILEEDNDRRWRIEHAQVVRPGDFHLFGKYQIIPSMQGMHCTSDMPWALDRVGPERISGAYAIRSLMEENGWFVNGTDFPVETIDPIHTFYSSVFRKPPGSDMEEGYLEENAIHREEAMKSMTIWAARGSFEEQEKGSIEPGKVADMVILDTDIMTAPEELIPDAKVWMTIVDGEIVYSPEK